MEFTYDEYCRFMIHMKSIATVVPLGVWDGSNVIILRHDVDFDIEAAYRMALLELDCGVRSTYFILTTCYAYNPCALRNRRMLAEMASLGFEIGLHFDPLVYGDINVDELKKNVDREAEILSSIVGCSVKSISIHNPSVHGKFPLFDGYCNAYSKEIFTDDCYLADSSMGFRGKDPYGFILRAKHRPIQVVFHPLHFSERGEAYPRLFLNRLKVFIKHYDEGLRVNVAYAQQMPSSLLSYLVKEINEESA